MDVLLSVKSKSDGAEQQVRCAVDGGITLGRSPQSPLALNGTGISRDHARFDAEGSALVVTDLSSNGTWVNGKRIPRGSPVTLKQDDCIELPGYEIRVRIPQEQPAITGPTAVSGPAPKAPAAARWWTNNPPVRLLLSFTGLERFVMVVAVLAVVLTLISL